MYLPITVGKYKIMAHVPKGNNKEKIITKRELIRTYLYKYRS